MRMEHIEWGFSLNVMAYLIEEKTTRKTTFFPKRIFPFQSLNSFHLMHISFLLTIYQFVLISVTHLLTHY